MVYKTHDAPQRNTEASSPITVAIKKQSYILVCARECVRVRYRARACMRACVNTGTSGRMHAHVALLIQHARRTTHTVSYFVISRAPLHFSTLSHGWQDFREKVIEHNICVLILPTSV
jgi:hypothetical protein